ncbi:hypothetical protein, partial [Dokdonella sp.]|uniref:hypothetical protein n=1 Tax=Dokdonella sp. TaxID=2291710 RepID=UPI0027B999F7
MRQLRCNGGSLPKGNDDAAMGIDAAHRWIQSILGGFMQKPITTAILAAIVGAGGTLAPMHGSHASAPPAHDYKVFAPKSVAPAGAELVESYGRVGLYRVDGSTRDA